LSIYNLNNEEINKDIGSRQNKVIPKSSRWHVLQNRSTSRENAPEKSAVLCDITDDRDISIININLKLSEQLLDLTARMYIIHLPRLIGRLPDS